MINLMNLLKLTVFASIIFLFSATSSEAFINIESLRQSNQVGLLGSVGFRVSGEIGNAEKFTGTINTIDGYLTEKREILIIADYGYGRSFGQRNRNDGRLHLRHTRKYDDFPDVETFAQSQFNEFTRLRNRSLAGANLRFQLFRDEHKFLYLGTGAFYEKQDRESSPNRDGVRANIYISYLYKLERNLEASITGYYQPYVNEFSDYWVNSNAGLEYFFRRSLSFRTEVNVSVDGNAPDGVKSTDIKYLTGFNFRY